MGFLSNLLSALPGGKAVGTGAKIGGFIGGLLDGPQSEGVPLQGARFGGQIASIGYQGRPYAQQLPEYQTALPPQAIPFALGYPKSNVRMY